MAWQRRHSVGGAGGFKAALGTLLALWCPAMLMAKRLPRIHGTRLADGVVGLAGRGRRPCE